MRPVALVITGMSWGAMLASSAGGCSLNAHGEGAGQVSGGAGADAQADAARDAVGEKNAVDAKSDGGCWWGTKPCAGACVDDADPAWGCALGNCLPCAIPHAEPKCANGACAVASCAKPWGECNGKPSDGCETRLDTLDNCGTCGLACSVAHGAADCSTGSCKVAPGGCSPGFADCNGDPKDGCETSLKTLKNCGACGKPCTVASGTPTCVTGKCEVDHCPAGAADCNGNSADGCETRLDTLADCGACDSPCSFAHGQASCKNMTCDLVGCDPGRGNCDGNPTNGCEVSTKDNKDNCGGCGAKCSGANGTNPACSGGLCSLTCDNGFADCNGPDPGGSDDGCEVAIGTSPDACGACGAKCEGTNVAAKACKGGRCVPTCAQAWADCNGPQPGSADDGCEQGIADDVHNCGECGKECTTTVAHATAVCKQSACDFACTAPWARCGASCADTATDPLHCGGCGWACNGANVAARACAGGKCAPSCSAGFADCNGPKPGNVDDGCEKGVASDPSACGACGSKCSDNHVKTLHCSAGVCDGACDSGYDDCNKDKLKDGCEADLSAPTSCGDCSKACGGGQVCRPSGCCTPDCSNPNCGVPDGCGGVCHVNDGFCGGGGSCVNGSCCVKQGATCPLADPYSSTPCCGNMICKDVGAGDKQCQPG
jgi:hypothetical protein